MRREISLLERAKKKELGVRRKRGLDELHGKYIIKGKSLSTVTEELKQGLLKVLKVKGVIIIQYMINSMFKSDQMKVYRELNGVPKIWRRARTLEKVNGFGVIFGVCTRKEAHWLKDIKTDFGRVVLTRETEVLKQVRNEKRKEKLVVYAR